MLESAIVIWLASPSHDAELRLAQVLALLTAQEQPRVLIIADNALRSTHPAVVEALGSSTVIFSSARAAVTDMFQQSDAMSPVH